MADKPRLLLVDDDTVTLQVLSKTLAPYARIRFARSGAEALQAVESELPDLLILDVNMPGLGGMEVLAQLRARPASAQLPVILVTSASDEALEATALQIGAQDFVRKPFQPELLVDRMRALLRLSALRARQPAALNLRSARILLVDDDPLAIESLRSTLAPLGATLLAAADGEEALAQMHNEVPDLVLLDAQMPRLDGYAVCQAMQTDPVLNQVPVAFVSVHAEAKCETLGFAVGASDFLAKPFKPDVLLARVRKLLQLRSEREETVNAIAAHWQELGDRRVAELVSVASDAIVSVDSAGVVRLMNKAAAALFGVSVERALGQPAEAVLPGWMALDFANEAMDQANERRRSGRLQRRPQPGTHGIGIARRAQLAVQRGRCLQCVCRRAHRVRRPASAQHAAQPAQAHPQLVQVARLGRARSHLAGIGQHLAQRLAQHGAAGHVDVGLARQAHRSPRGRRAAGQACSQGVTQLALAAHIQQQAMAAGPAPGQRQQRLRRAGQQFEFDLAQRQAARAGLHRAFVQRQLDQRATAAQQAPGALHRGGIPLLQHGLAGIGQQAAQRRTGGRAVVAGDVQRGAIGVTRRRHHRRVVLQPLQRAGAFGLQRLDPGVALAAQAQGHARGGQVLAGCVEVGCGQRLHLGGGGGHRAPQRGQPPGRNAELELDFSGHAADAAMPAPCW